LTTSDVSACKRFECEIKFWNSCGIIDFEMLEIEIGQAEKQGAASVHELLEINLV
jgi:hypothetical protein